MTNDNDEFVPPTATASDITTDLAALDQTWETTKPAEGFSQVPAGKYQAYVDKAFITRGKQPPHNLLLKMELVISGPTHEKQRLFRNNVLATPENIAWCKKDLAMCGIELAKASDLPTACAQLIGLGLNVTVTVKPPALGQDRPTTNVYIDGTFGRKPEEAQTDDLPQ